MLFQRERERERLWIVRHFQFRASAKRSKLGSGVVWRKTNKVACADDSRLPSQPDRATHHLCGGVLGCVVLVGRYIVDSSVSRVTAEFR